MIRRFFARFMDLCFFLFLFFEICVDFIPRFFGSRKFWNLLFDLDLYSICHHLYFSILLSYSLSFIIFLFITVIFLALISSIFGTTPGKAAFGVEVLPEAVLHGIWRRFGFYLWREIRVWVFGLGCGCLLITPIFMIWQALRLRAGKTAFYDRAGKVRITFVKAKILVFIIWLPGTLIMLAFIVTVLVFNIKIYQVFQQYECSYYEKSLK